MHGRFKLFSNILIALTVIVAIVFLILMVKSDWLNFDPVPFIKWLVASVIVIALVTALALRAAYDEFSGTNASNIDASAELKKEVEELKKELAKLKAEQK